MFSEASGGESRPQGCCRAEHVQITSGNEVQEQPRDVLEAGERKDWHLVGVAGGLPGVSVILFWDTRSPSFGRASW